MYVYTSGIVKAVKYRLTKHGVHGGGVWVLLVCPERRIEELVSLSHCTTAGRKDRNNTGRQNPPASRRARTQDRSAHPRPNRSRGRTYAKRNRGGLSRRIYSALAPRSLFTYKLHRVNHMGAMLRAFFGGLPHHTTPHRTLCMRSQHCASSNSSLVQQLLSGLCPPLLQG